MIYPNDYKDLTNYVNSGKNIFFFTASWCGDCMFIKPQIPEIEAAHPEFTFIEIDRDRFIDIAIKWNILGIPSFVALDNGKEIGRYVDKLRKTKEEINIFINNLAQK